MYTAKYWVAGINSENNENVRSYLEAKFRFGQETTSRDRTHIKSRIDGISKNGFQNYSKEKDFLGIFPDTFRLGFDLDLNVKGEVPRKEMFDLDALNDFILTGEVKE